MWLMILFIAVTLYRLWLLLVIWKRQLALCKTWWLPRATAKGKSQPVSIESFTHVDLWLSMSVTAKWKPTNTKWRSGWFWFSIVRKQHLRTVSIAPLLSLHWKPMCDVCSTNIQNKNPWAVIAKHCACGFLLNANTKTIRMPTLTKKHRQKLYQPRDVLRPSVLQRLLLPPQAA